MRVLVVCDCGNSNNISGNKGFDIIAEDNGHILDSTLSLTIKCKNCGQKLNWMNINMGSK